MDQPLPKLPKAVRRLPRRKRKAYILQAIVNLAETRGLYNFTIRDIAEQSECSESTIKIHFGTMKNIREETVIYADQKGLGKILSTPVINIIGAC
jgi:AcrR family transcriptional regulator